MSVPGSCQAPGKSQMAPVTALQDHSRIALLILSVKHLFHLKPSNYLYIMTRHTRQRKTPLCVPRHPGKPLKHTPALLYLTHNSFFCCSLDTQHLHSAFIIFTFNIRLCHPGQATLAVIPQGHGVFYSQTPLGCAVVTPAPLAGRFFIAWTLIFPTLGSGPVGDTGTHPFFVNNWRKDVCHLFLSEHIPPAAHGLLFCPGECLQFASGSGHLDEESAFSLLVFRHIHGH